MAELQHAYCTVDDLREQLGDLQKKNLSENLLIRAINAASRAVDDHTGRRFWADATPVVRYVKPVANDCELWLPWDIASTTGLEIATDTGGNGTYATVWGATDYQLGPDNANTPGSLYGGWSKIESTGRLRFDVYGTAGLLRVRITARGGFSFIPDPVNQATVLKAAQLFKRKDAPFGVAQFGDVAAVQVNRRDIDVLDLLRPYILDAAMVG